MKIHRFFIRVIAMFQFLGSGISILWSMLLTMPGTVPPESMLHKYGETSATWFYLKNLGSIVLFLPLFLAAVGIFFFMSWGKKLFLITNSMWGVLTIAILLSELIERRFKYFVEDGLFVFVFFIVWYFGTAVYLLKFYRSPDSISIDQ